MKEDTLLKILKKVSSKKVWEILDMLSGGIRTYMRLLGYAKPYWHLVVFVVFCATVASLLAVLPSQVMGVAFDVLFGAQKGSTSPLSGGSSLEGKTLPISPMISRVTEFFSVHVFSQLNPHLIILLVLAGAFLGLHLLSAGIRVAQSLLNARLSQFFIYDLRNDTYEHLLRKSSLRYFEVQKTGDIMSRVINDVNTLQSSVDPLIEFITDILRVGWVLYFCFQFDRDLTWLALIVAPLLLPLTHAFGMILRKSYRVLRQIVGELSAIAQDHITGIRIIKNFAGEDSAFGHFKEFNYRHLKVNLKINKLTTLFAPILGTLTQAGSLVVLTYGGWKVLRGEMSIGMFAAFFPYLGMLYGPFMGISLIFTNIQRALASVERVFEILDQEDVIKDAEDALVPDPFVGKVEFRNVSFRYGDSGDQVLQDVSFVAEPGQMIALVGPSGAGKTTIVNLLMRFYDPALGSILVDGIDLRRWKMAALRGKIGVVPQDPFLFNAPVDDNIRYGKRNASQKAIQAAATLAAADEFIAGFPEGYRTVIGERGVRLSGGQRQRLAIARAILVNPKILILDEATSSLDTRTEMKIQDAIHRLVSGRTTFVIAHRLSTVRKADFIVVLDSGRVVQQGTHEALLAQGGLYRELYDVQFAEEDSETGQDVRVDDDAREMAQKLSEIIEERVKDLDIWSTKKQGESRG